MLSHALAPEGDAVSIVHDTVEYGVSDRAVCNKVMPACHGDLGRDQSGLPLIAFLDDFEEVEALLIGECMRSKVIEDEKLDAGELVDKAGKGAIVSAQFPAPVH